jgi:hypothetical protein
MSDARDRRLDELLDLLATDRQAPPRDLAHDVVRTARWQRAVRGSLAAASDLSAALGDFALLVVSDRRGRRP